MVVCGGAIISARAGSTTAKTMPRTAIPIVLQMRLSQTPLELFAVDGAVAVLDGRERELEG